MAKSRMFNRECSCTRREFMRKGLYGVGVTAALPTLLQSTAKAFAEDALLDKEANPNRFLVVLELSGGNDGLNTVIPYGDDAYYRARPVLGQPESTIRKINEYVGFHESAQGFETLFKEGHMAVVNGCGYPNPNLSHFVSAEYWHTGVPHGAEERGWIGRLADTLEPSAKDNMIVNISPEMTLAVSSGVHAPVVFSDPERFQRLGSEAQQKVFDAVTHMKPQSDNPALQFMHGIERNAASSSVLVREACSAYNTPVDYGPMTGGGVAQSMSQVAALVNAGFPTRFYYVNYGGFDTHVSQGATHNLLLQYASDAIRGFMDDMDRIGRGDDYAIMVFSEFGRRVQENAGGGTDHGTAGPMFVFGRNIKGGLYGKYPSLTDLDANGNFRMTTDFRHVYATVIKEWMGHTDTKTLLKGDFDTLGMFA